jgi:hypothetical protein
MAVRAAVVLGRYESSVNYTFDPAWEPGSAVGFETDVDGAGNRFNPNKLLLEPFSLEVSELKVRFRIAAPAGSLIRFPFRAIAGRQAGSRCHVGR